jgi:hypothetical protein
MPTTVKLKNSVTSTNVPSSLVQGEVAINVTDKKVWVGNAASGVVQIVGPGSTDLAVADGGTGASTAANARTNLSAAASGANSDITSLTGLTTPLSQAQGGTGTTTGYYALKNRIINGAMVIDQRNAGASVTAGATSAYFLDRWNFNCSQASKLSFQQNAGSVTLPAGFTNYLGATSLSAYTVGAGELFTICQIIEGYNTSDLGWGTANAKTVTLSFQVYSSLTGTFGGSIRNYAGSRSYPFTYSISTANTWTTISVTIAGDTGGTTSWNLGTSTGSIIVWFGLGVGTTLSGTAGSWSGSNYVSATGATSVVGTNGATFYITGVQLEVGTQATGFEYRQYGTELALCQRYFQIALISASECVIGGIRASGQVQFGVPLKVNMRGTPSPTLNTVIAQDLTNGSNYTLTGLSIQNGEAVSGFINFSGTWSSGGTAGAASNVYGNTANNGGIFLSSEL